MANSVRPNDAVALPHAPDRPSLLSFHVTHRWADPSAVQAAATAPAATLAKDLHGIAGVEGCVALVTCHRSEVYLTGRKTRPIEDAVGAYFRSKRYRSIVGGAGPGFRPRSPLRQMKDNHSVGHLFRVAAGLDSVIVGESEVLGQVRSAMKTAVESGTIDVTLRQVFDAAIEVGRRVRSETGLGAQRRGLGAVVWKAVETHARDRVGTRVLLVGAGQAATSIAEAVPGQWKGILQVVSRTDARSGALAQQAGAQVRPFSELHDAIQESNVCILAAPTPPALVCIAAKASPARRERLVLDVCQPPNVGHAVEAKHIDYWDLPMILQRGHTDGASIQAATADAERLVDAAVERFRRQREDAATPAGRLVRLLQVQGQRIAQRELDTALRRLPDLDDRERAALEDFARSLRQKLLMTPTLALRRSLAGGRPDLTREILALFEGEFSPVGTGGQEGMD